MKNVDQWMIDKNMKRKFKIPTVNIDARKKLAHHIRNLATGIITWHEYIEFDKDGSGGDKTVDAIWAMIFNAYDPDYPDSHPPKEFAARTILFLNTTLQYEWQDTILLDFLLFHIDLLTFKLFSKKLKSLESLPYEEQGDVSIYPFRRKEDFENARKHTCIFGVEK